MVFISGPTEVGAIFTSYCEIMANPAIVCEGPSVNEMAVPVLAEVVLSMHSDPVHCLLVRGYHDIRQAIWKWHHLHGAIARTATTAGQICFSVVPTATIAGRNCFSVVPTATIARRY